MLTLDIKGTALFTKLSGQTLIKGIHKGIINVLLFLENKAIPETPIMTGTLRKGYYVKSYGMWGKLSNKTEYAPFVHDGTRNINANPFLKRVEKDNSSNAGRIMNKEIAKVLSIL